MVWNPPVLQCWQGGWRFPRYKGQKGEKWGEGEKSCKTSPVVVFFLGILLAANTEGPGGEKVEILEEKWGLGVYRSWIHGVGEAVTHLP